MRNIKKIICMLVAMIMVLSSLVGCQKADTEQTTATTGTEGTKASESTTAPTEAVDSGPVQELPISTEGITLTVAIPVSTKVEDLETNQLTLYIEEQTGINLEFIQLSTSDTAAQINSLMNGGDLPDIFLGYEFSYATLCSYADAGLLQPLDEYIDTWGYNLKNTIMTDPDLGENVLDYVTYDDHVWAMPAGGGLVSNVYGKYQLRIQDAFLEEMNMKLPKTLDELRAFLAAVKEKHPDVTPMTAFSDYNYIFEAISQAYQYTDRITYLKVNDGQIEFIANNDEFKAAIEYTKSMVDDGLIDPAAWTQDKSVLASWCSQEGNNVAVYGGGYTTAAVFDSTGEEYNGLRLLGVVEGPNGYASTQLDGSAANVRVSMVVTSACEYPEEAFRLFDFFLSDDFAIAARVGFEGEQWEKSAEGAIARDGEQAWFTLLDTQEWSKSSTNVIWVNENFIHCNILNHCEATDANQKYPLGEDIGNLELKEKTSDEQLPQLIMSAEDSTEYNELRNLIVNSVKSNVAQFILGNRDLSEWDDYCNELESMGLDRYIELVQTAYDSMA